MRMRLIRNTIQSNIALHSYNDNKNLTIPRKTKEHDVNVFECRLSSLLATSLGLLLGGGGSFVLLHAWIDDLESSLDASRSPDAFRCQMATRHHVFDFLLLLVLGLLVQPIGTKQKNDRLKSLLPKFKDQIPLTS